MSWYGKIKGHLGLNGRKIIQMLGTHSFTNINTGKVFVKEVKNLFGVTLVIVHINLATKIIAYEIKASERIVVLKVFSRMIKFFEGQGPTFLMQHRL